MVCNVPSNTWVVLERGEVRAEKEAAYIEYKNSLRDTAKQILPYEHRTHRCAELVWGKRQVKGSKKRFVKIKSSGKRGYLTNVSKCENRTLCADCGEVLWQRTGDELQAILVGVRKAGWLAYTVTGGVPHTKTDRFTDTLDALLRANNFLSQGKAGHALFDNFLGHVRINEVTFGPHGWHPHTHFVLVFDHGDITRAEETCRRFVARWRVGIEKFSRRETAAAAFHFVRIDDDAGQAHYLTVASQRATPENRQNGHRTPLDILSDYHKHPNAQDRALFREIAEGLNGVRMVTFAKNLRKRFPAPHRPPLPTIALIEEAVLRTVIRQKLRSELLSHCKHSGNIVAAYLRIESWCATNGFAGSTRPPADIAPQVKRAQRELREIAKRRARLCRNPRTRPARARRSSDAWPHTTGDAVKLKPPSPRSLGGPMRTHALSPIRPTERRRNSSQIGSVQPPGAQHFSRNRPNRGRASDGTEAGAAYVG